MDECEKIIFYKVRGIDFIRVWLGRVVIGKGDYIFYISFRIIFGEFYFFYLGRIYSSILI